VTGVPGSEVSGLIHGHRFVTVRQAKLIEKALHISGQELWTEGVIAKGMREYAKVRAAK
jgi:hypothetical protein